MKIATKPDSDILMAVSNRVTDKIYGFDSLDKLCMVVENEHNQAAIDAL